VADSVYHSVQVSNVSCYMPFQPLPYLGRSYHLGWLPYLCVRGSVRPAACWTACTHYIRAFLNNLHILHILLW
jgi:hypothetical protein